MNLRVSREAIVILTPLLTNEGPGFLPANLSCRCGIQMVPSPVVTAPFIIKHLTVLDRQIIGPHTGSAPSPHLSFEI